uniref:C6 domain-containing protein n=1 Tax=Panagrolaimus sp. PS1159 TaxID=55785 RepID=A0AC35FZW1_9BILA
MSIYSLVFIVALCWISSTLGNSSEESLNSISNFDKRWICKINVPVESCNTCYIDKITFTPMSSADTETPTYVGPKIGKDGCLNLVATCPATNMGWVFMQFNTNEGGPSSPTGTGVNAILKCENGNWVFDGLPNRIITEVNCVIALQKKLIME